MLFTLVAAFPRPDASALTERLGPREGVSSQISLSQDLRHPSQDHSTGGGAPQDQAPTAGSVGISRP